MTSPVATRNPGLKTRSNNLWRMICCSVAISIVGSERYHDPAEWFLTTCRCFGQDGIHQRLGKSRTLSGGFL